MLSLPLAIAPTRTLLSWLRERAIRIVAARVQAATDYREADLRGPLAIAVGSEAGGLGPDWLAEGIEGFACRCSAGRIRSTCRPRPPSSSTKPVASAGAKDEQRPNRTIGGSFSKAEASRARHRSPGGVITWRPLLLPAGPAPQRGPFAGPTYTPAVISRADPHRASRPRRRIAVVVAAVASLVVTAVLVASPGAAAGRPARILMGEPATLDPAAAGDAGSAAVIAQLFEGLTAIDPTRTPRPALAERWDFAMAGD